MITIQYTGEYPNTCSGTLTIIEDDKVIYDEKFCCYSTGSVWFDDNWSEHVESGRLLWNQEEASKFSPEVQSAVRGHLSMYHVCCGGCV